ncbi:MAG: coproporphyrinogen III oxidase, partial [Candidatus Krumholzibacteria bacterium]|nr:coproporphyrinogen III oxidase [Candidatus Krumholzibacteria bacterium]
DIEAKYEIDFNDYFSDALKKLESFVGDGLATLEDDLIRITPPGRLLIRNIVMNFDAYLERKDDDKPRFSRTV